MKHARMMVTALCLTVSLTVGTAGTTRADDGKGNYILRGIGAQSCKSFVEAEQTSAEAVSPYVNWMEGYISGINRFQDETFDAAPVIASSNVGALVRNLCNVEPDIRFETAIARLMAFFGPYRIKEQSQLIEMTVGDASAAVRQETLRWMQEKLTEKGLYTGEVNGLFGSDTRSALTAFQQAQGLKVTGVPDTMTIMRFIQEDVQPQAQ